jgi:hypothetical protein
MMMKEKIAMGQHFDSMQEAEKLRKAKMRQFKEKGASLVS